ncbi:MAG: hypothetical protein CO042_02400 [Parcubacteria group bacterium CG_4_9_14_0_2_um_filter_41_8]|nr:MAG: hypothetical protein COW93_03630 [Parcubacteria group bacterium CG22_combo_CG10-13_8_21_14_all_41_9]PIR57338.1 MAG: hypothetical protein COU72_01505 [Parcubacteria group bacterium CG10_big_fil_rev_8_21_14_0_10_41_35]PJC40703.1 MAG: hypothetical protein CO042_02400 [Parcubacteria group bacterium CG_4_9_14_0_2_um_filter_41_8]
MQVPKRKSEQGTQREVDPHITQEKFDELKASLGRMMASRPRLAKDVQTYAANGDFSENAEYQIAKGKLRGLNRRIDETKDKIHSAIIIKPKTDSDIAGLGSTVTIKSDSTQKTYQILGSQQACPEQGIISQNSPIGAQLIGKRVGESVKIKTRTAEKEYTIIGIA